MVTVFLFCVANLQLASTKVAFKWPRAPCSSTAPRSTESAGWLRKGKGTLHTRCCGVSVMARGSRRKNRCPIKICVLEGKRKIEKLPFKLLIFLLGAITFGLTWLTKLLHRSITCNVTCERLRAWESSVQCPLTDLLINFCPWSARS